VPRAPVQIWRALVTVPPATNVVIPIQSRDWWASQSQFALQAPIPQGLYYDRQWPDGTVWLWPIPSLPYQLWLGTDLEIGPVADTDTLDLPQGYAELLRLWTAKKAAPAFAREFSTASQAALTECLGDIFGANIGRVNDADTRDGGVPGARGGVYDYRTGLVS
jgi:hypothetical protein